MLLRKNYSRKKNKAEGNRRTLNIFHLLDCFGELKEKGYFYLGEYVYTDAAESIWDEEEAKRFELTEEWLERIKLQSVIAIQMVFAHFITRERKYLNIRRKIHKYGVGTVIWLADKPDELDGISPMAKWTTDKPPILEKMLQKCEMIVVPGKFYKLNASALREKIKGSLFVLLYQNGWRQVQEGKIKIKKDCHDENSFAWAGEFVQHNFVGEREEYLEIAVYRREYEEWESIYGDGEICVLKEVRTEVYVAKGSEPLSEVCLSGEQRIPLKKIEAAEEMNAYLDAFYKLDCTLEDCSFEAL